MTKQYDYTRIALTKVRKSRTEQTSAIIPSRLLPAVYVALASMERFLKAQGKDKPDPSERPDAMLPRDLIDAENDCYYKVTPADLAENGGYMAFILPPRMDGYSDWKVHTGEERPEGVRANDNVRILLKNSTWKPGRDALENARFGRANKFTWDQHQNGNDIIYWCKEGG